MRSWKIGISLIVTVSLIVGSTLIYTNNLNAQTSNAQLEQIQEHVISENNVLIWEIMDNPDYLDPHVNYESIGDWVLYNVYETLYTYPWDSAVTQPSVNLLAASAPVLSADGLNITIVLREDITFHDGTPFNASCVKWNVERAMKIFYLDGPVWMLAESLKGGSIVEDAAYSYGPFSSQFESAFDNWVETSGAIEVIDEFHVRFVLEEPYPAFIPALTYTVGAMMSPSYAIAHASHSAWSTWETYGVDYGEFENYMSDHTCGTGPYMVTEWVPDQFIELDLYTNYWRTSTSTSAGSIEKVFIRYADYSSRSYNLRTGLSDGCYWEDYSADDVWNSATGESLYDHIVVSTGGYSFDIEMAGFNMGSMNTGTDTVPDEKISPFYWGNFRKAASWAFDYDAYISGAHNEFGIQGRGPIPIGMFGHNSAYFDWEFNLTAAVEEWNLAMADSAFVDALNDLDNNLVFYYDSENIEREQLCLLMIDGLSAMYANPDADKTGLAASMQFTAQALEWNDYLDHIRLRNMPFFFMGWTPDYADPDNYLFPLVYQRGVYAQRICYNNSDVNEWYLLQQVETDSSTRIDYLNLIQEEVSNDAPYLWACQETEFRTFGTWLHGDGFVYNPMHDIYFYHMYKEDPPAGIEITTPVLSHPDDIVMVVGTTGLNVTWIATDIHRDVYEISQNDMIIDSGDWTSYEIVTSLDGLTLGEHNFTLTVTNLGGNNASDTVTVTVVSSFNLTQTLILIVSIGSAGVIIVVVILIVKMKKE